MAGKIKWDSKLTPEENATRMLPPLVSAYLEAGRQLNSGPVEPAALHRFRLEGKRLRYAMELFAPCYGPGLSRYLELLRSAQTSLGDLNDCAVLSHRLTELPSPPEDREKAERYLAARSKKLYASFLRFWHQEADAPGVEQRWLTYIAHPRSRKK
jgi:CHAD domain-containing protein